MLSLFKGDFSRQLQDPLVPLPPNPLGFPAVFPFQPEAFDLFDTDGSGEIDSKELKVLEDRGENLELTKLCAMKKRAPKLLFRV